MTAVSDETGRDWLPLKYEDGPDFCTVTFATGAAFALTVHPERMKLMEAALSAAPVETWKCAARKQSLPEPADCGWPTCGCDPYADKVIAALEEQGSASPVAQEPVARLVPIKNLVAMLALLPPAPVDVNGKQFAYHDPKAAERLLELRSVFDALIAASPLYTSPPATPAGLEEDWRDDPSADERWQAGLDYGMERFCSMLGVDPKDVRWDAATEELDGDVCAVIGNILRVKFGDDFDPMKPLPSAGLGADEIARVFARWKKSKNLHESLAAQNIEKELLALLSRAGDQK